MQKSRPHQMLSNHRLIPFHLTLFSLASSLLVPGDFVLCKESLLPPIRGGMSPPSNGYSLPNLVLGAGALCEPHLRVIEDHIAFQPGSLRTRNMHVFGITPFLPGVTIDPYEDRCDIMPYRSHFPMTPLSPHPMRREAFFDGLAGFPPMSLPHKRTCERSLRRIPSSAIIFTSDNVAPWINVSMCSATGRTSPRTPDWRICPCAALIASVTPSLINASSGRCLLFPPSPRAICRISSRVARKSPGAGVSTRSSMCK